MGIMDRAKDAAQNLDKDQVNEAVDKGQEHVSNEDINQRIDDAQEKFGGDRQEQFGGEAGEGAGEDQR